MGVCWVMIGLGYYVVSLLVLIVKYVFYNKWYLDDFNNGIFEYYMFLLVGFMLINLVVFLYLVVRYWYVGEGFENDGYCVFVFIRVLLFVIVVKVEIDVCF